MVLQGPDPLEGLFLAELAQEGFGSRVYHHVVLQFGLRVAHLLAGPTGELGCRGVMFLAVVEKGGGIPKIFIAGSTVMCSFLQMLGLQMVPQPGTGTVGFLAELAVQVLGSEARDDVFQPVGLLIGA